MVQIKTPFWIATKQVHFAIDHKSDSHNPPQTAYLFTSIGEFGDFLLSLDSDEWRTSLISSNLDTLAAVVKLHSCSVDAIWVNPFPDGTGGKLIPLIDLQPDSAVLETADASRWS